MALTEQGVSPRELGRPAPLTVIFPVLVSWAFSPPGPQIPRIAALTVTSLIENEWIPSTRSGQGKPLGDTAMHVAPLNVAPVIIAPFGPLVPVSFA